MPRLAQALIYTADVREANLHSCVCLILLCICVLLMIHVALTIECFI